MTPESFRFLLRPWVEADHDSVAEIWHSSASLPDVGVPVMPSLPDMRRRVDAEIAAGWKVTVAFDPEGILGFVAIKPEEATLSELFVRPGLLGRGVGRALLDHAKSAMPNGFTLYTRKSNGRARRFYENAGLKFQRDDVHPRAGDPVVHYGWSPV